jgi:hypothetical protein
VSKPGGAVYGFTLDAAPGGEYGLAWSQAGRGRAAFGKPGAKPTSRWRTPTGFSGAGLSFFGSNALLTWSTILTSGAQVFAAVRDARGRVGPTLQTLDERTPRDVAFFGPLLAIDRKGGQIAVWRRWQYTASPFRTQVLVAFRKPGKRFGAPTVLGEGGGALLDGEALVMAPSGAAAVLLGDVGGRMLALREPGKPFRKKVRLARSPYARVIVAVGSSGRFVALTSEGGGAPGSNRMVARLGDVRRGVTSRRTLDTHAESPLAVNVDDRGRVLAVWQAEQPDAIKIADYR